LGLGRSELLRYLKRCCAVVAIAALSGSMSCLHPTSTADGCTVIVTESEARIAFPAVNRAEWRWNRPPADSSSSAPMYVWSLHLYDGGGLHVDVSRSPVRGPVRIGDLATMLRDAEVVVTKYDPRHVAEFFYARSLKPRAVSGRVVVVVRDRTVLRELFDRRPTESRCDFYAEGEPDPPWVWGKVRYMR
jgi:hypothetical protein